MVSYLLGFTILTNLLLAIQTTVINPLVSKTGFALGFSHLHGVDLLLLVFLYSVFAHGRSVALAVALYLGILLDVHTPTSTGLYPLLYLLLFGALIFISNKILIKKASLAVPLLGCPLEVILYALFHVQATNSSALLDQLITTLPGYLLLQLLFYPGIRRLLDLLDYLRPKRLDLTQS